MSSSEQFFIMAVTFNPSDSQTGFGVSLPDFWSFYRLLADWKKWITAAVDVFSCGPGGLKVNRLAAAAAASCSQQFQTFCHTSVLLGLMENGSAMGSVSQTFRYPIW